MEYRIINAVSSTRVPAWGNGQKYIAIHYLGVDGQNRDIDSDGCGAHYYIYWDGTIYQRCSHDAIVWQVGTAGYYTQKHPTARNANTIGIEMCCHCDGNAKSAEDPYWYFTEETQQACIWLVQKLMKELNIPAENVLRHYDIVNKTCPAPYVHNNGYRGSWTWEQFKARLISTDVSTLYRVRLRWDLPETQIGAYWILENAKSNCPAGYSVYDESGKDVYTAVDAASGAAPAKYPSGIPTNKEAYISACGAIAQELYPETHILPSVVVAQCCLETGFGLGADSATLMQVNNLIGMKTDLINGSWKQYSVWNGESISKLTPEYYSGQLRYITDSFRKYTDYENCLRDYEMFLLHVQNSKGLKYARVAGMTDPAMVIHAIRIGTGTDTNSEGYCTDPVYETKILNLIREYNLTRFDQTSQPMSEPEEPKQEDTTVIIPTAADFVAAMKHLNTVMKQDNKNGNQWRYYNGKRSENTFEKTRKAGKYFTNCMGGVTLAAKYAGVPGSALDWYGDKGQIHWLNKDAKKNAEKYFDIIPVKTKTVQQCMKDGTLKPGDIVTFMTLTHTNAYYAENKSFDAGHAFCDGSGEGAAFKKWIGTTPYKNYKIAYIFRLKSNGVVYRVQIGAYSRQTNADKCVAECKAKTGFQAFYEKMADGQHHVFCGSFENKENANDRVTAIRGAYPGAFMKMVNIS